MRDSLILRSVVNVLTGLGMAGALFAASVLSAAPASAEMQLHVVERATSDTVTDLGAKGDSVGDILTFSNEIFDGANQSKIGVDNGFCIRTVVGKAWECFWTIALARGHLTVEGPFLDAGDSVLAVTGGTGSYATERGEMALHARDAKGSEYDFTYTLK
ncbi:MAG TPA: allene oxide cyclase family protein [Dongiaceae bacterium]|nr:allene oxide cyclase family protein [Dongiaceae bacterium]